MLGLVLSHRLRRRRQSAAQRPRFGGQRVVVGGALAVTLGLVACTSSNNNNANNNNVKGTLTTVATTVSSPTTVAARTATPAGATTAVRPASPTAAPATARPASPTAAPGVRTATPSGGATNIPTVNITTREYSYDAPTSIPAGLTRLHMQNSGMEDHQTQLLRLNPPTSFADFLAAVQKDPNSALALVTTAGGPNTAAPGGNSDVIDDLQAGQYVLICFVSGADNVPHVAKGMIKPLQVTASTAATIPLPTAPATVAMREFSYMGPATLPAGPTTVNVTNSGTQPHEMSLIKLNGITADQLKAVLASPNGPPPSGPPPFTSAGGLGAINPGATGQAILNLTPGNYAMICFVPDPATGKDHASLGMVQGFTVR